MLTSINEQTLVRALALFYISNKKYTLENIDQYAHCAHICNPQAKDGIITFMVIQNDNLVNVICYVIYETIGDKITAYRNLQWNGQLDVWKNIIKECFYETTSNGIW